MEGQPEYRGWREGEETYAGGYTRRSKEMGTRGSPSVAGRRISRLRHGRGSPVEGRDPPVPRYRADIEAGEVVLAGESRARKPNTTYW